MFRSKEQPPLTVHAPSRTGEPEIRSSGAPTLIAEGAEVRGEVKTPGSILIEGRVEGTISATGDIQIGAKGSVSAEIEAKNVTVSGRVKGKIYAEDKVVLVSGSHVEGDIHSQSLRIEDAVYFEGGCMMGEGARKRRADDNIALPSTLKQKKAA